MKIFIYCMSILIILSETERAQAVITYALEDPVTLEPSGFSILDSRFSLFEPRTFHESTTRPLVRGNTLRQNFTYLSTTHRDGGLNLTFDNPAIFPQTKTVSWLDENPEDLRITGNDYFVDPHLMNQSWVTSVIIESFDVKYPKVEGPVDQTNTAHFDNPSKIEDAGYGVIDFVPAPGAFILGSFGLGMVGWLRRHRSL